MPKFLIRIVALLLVPCLAGGQLSAFCSLSSDLPQTPLAPLGERVQGEGAIFNQQALAARLANQSRGPLAPEEVEAEEFQEAARLRNVEPATPADSAKGTIQAKPGRGEEQHYGGRTSDERYASEMGLSKFDIRRNSGFDSQHPPAAAEGLQAPGVLRTGQWERIESPPEATLYRVTLSGNRRIHILSEYPHPVGIGQPELNLIQSMRVDASREKHYLTEDPSPDIRRLATGIHVVELPTINDGYRLIRAAGIVPLTDLLLASFVEWAVVSVQGFAIALDRAPNLKNSNDRSILMGAAIEQTAHQLQMPEVEVTEHLSQILKNLPGDAALRITRATGAVINASNQEVARVVKKTLKTKHGNVWIRMRGAA